MTPSLEYNLTFRVFRGDTGWRYGIQFTHVIPRPGVLPAEQIVQFTYPTEQRATTAGLRALSKAISQMRKTVQIAITPTSIKVT